MLVLRPRWAEEWRCIPCVKNSGRYVGNASIPWTTWSAHQASRTWRDYQHRCGQCGRWFLGALARRWCSEACGELGRAARRDRHRAVGDVVCETCGELFTPTRADARYCSPACRQKAYRQRRLIHGSGARPENRPLSGPVSPADDRPRTQGADDPDR